MAVGGRDGDCHAVHGRARQRGAIYIYIYCIYGLYIYIYIYIWGFTWPWSDETETARTCTASPGRGGHTPLGTAPASVRSTCAGSYLRLIDFVHHSNLGLRVIKKKTCATALGVEGLQRTHSSSECRLFKHGVAHRGGAGPAHTSVGNIHEIVGHNHMSVGQTHARVRHTRECVYGRGVQGLLGTHPAVALYRGACTGVPRLQEPATPEDPTVGSCLGSYGLGGQRSRPCVFNKDPERQSRSKGNRFYGSGIMV